MPTAHQALRRLPPRAAGFTIVEVLVAVSVLTLGAGLVGSSVFQVLSVDRYWRDDVVATREWRHAGSLFASDALNAETVSLVDGAPATSAVTFTWTAADGTAHTATYGVSGGNMLRTLDANQMVAAEQVVSASFSRSGKTVTFNLEVPADRGNTESMSLQTYLRKLP
ncbi:MAG: prepilin-type N-terminal cleavage/methylation domain-containing protein [Chloroflexi bacterium]|nr:prepilin-type N-terminal cleavage/methylation domain-containing protein [Chloroflexota bacterium]